MSQLVSDVFEVDGAAMFRAVEDAVRGAVQNGRASGVVFFHGGQPSLPHVCNRDCLRVSDAGGAGITVCLESGTAHFCRPDTCVHRVTEVDGVFCGLSGVRLGSVEMDPAELLFSGMTSFRSGDVEVVEPAIARRGGVSAAVCARERAATVASDERDPNGSASAAVVSVTGIATGSSNGKFEQQISALPVLARIGSSASTLDYAEYADVARRTWHRIVMDINWGLRAKAVIGELQRRCKDTISQVLKEEPPSPSSRPSIVDKILAPVVSRFAAAVERFVETSPDERARLENAVREQIIHESALLWIKLKFYFSSDKCKCAARKRRIRDDCDGDDGDCDGDDDDEGVALGGRKRRRTRGAAAADEDDNDGSNGDPYTVSEFGETRTRKRRRRNSPRSLGAMEIRSLSSSPSAAAAAVSSSSSSSVYGATARRACGVYFNPVICECGGLSAHAGKDGFVGARSSDGAELLPPHGADYHLIAFISERNSLFSETEFKIGQEPPRKLLEPIPDLHKITAHTLDMGGIGFVPYLRHAAVGTIRRLVFLLAENGVSVF